LLANGMDELRQNLAAAGLTLGQTQIGGQAGSQSSSLGGGGSDGSSPRQQSGGGANEQSYAEVSGGGPDGIRAYA